MINIKIGKKEYIEEEWLREKILNGKKDKNKRGWGQEHHNQVNPDQIDLVQLIQGQKFQKNLGNIPINQKGGKNRDPIVKEERTLKEKRIKLN